MEKSTTSCGCSAVLVRAMSLALLDSPLVRLPGPMVHTWTAAIHGMAMKVIGLSPVGSSASVVGSIRKCGEEAPPAERLAALRCARLKDAS